MHETHSAEEAKDLNQDDWKQFWRCRASASFSTFWHSDVVALRWRQRGTPDPSRHRVPPTRQHLHQLSNNLSSRSASPPRRWRETWCEHIIRGHEVVSHII